MREDSIHRGQLLAQLPRLVDAMLADPGLERRVMDEVAPIRPLPEQERDNGEELERWDLCD